MSPTTKARHHLTVRKSTLAAAFAAAGLVATLTPAGLSAAAPAAPAASAPSTATPASAQAASLPSGRTTYRTWADYKHDMAQLSRQYPGLVHQITLPNRTTKGEKVYGLEISAGAGKQDGKPDLLITGMHHGNEWASGEVAMEFGYSLTQGYGKDARITRLLDRARVIIVPVVNVDGFLANQRVNGRGVDMNRNYGLGWSGIPTSENVGTGPFSEPEARNVRDVISTNQVTTFLTMHTCEAMVLYPPIAFQEGEPQDTARFAALAQAIARPIDYEAKPSADDYQTTGEAIAWSYYATRGLGFTVEDCTIPAFDPSVPKTFQTMVVNQYLGKGAYTGNARGGMRSAFLVALENTARPSAHATITGQAPRGAVLKVDKKFNLWTAPMRLPNGSIGALPVPTHLTSTLTANAANGAFRWAVNPSARPVSPYRADGIHTSHPGFTSETWTLTCSRPDGTVLQKTQVRVGLGQTARVDLGTCRRAF